MAPSNVAWRAPAIPYIADTANLITVVSDPAVCRRALHFHRREMPRDSAVSVEVIRVDTVFVISNPGHLQPGDEWTGRWVADSRMLFLQAYLHGS
jgi:hypothetical protein